MTTIKPIHQTCRRLRLGLLTLLASSLVTTSLLAADYTWIGATGLDWNEAANWSPNGVPNATGDNILINTAGTVSLTNVPNTAFTVGNITNAQTVTTSSVLGQNNTTDDILTLAVASGSPVISVTNSGQALFLYCSLAGSQGFTKAGAGRASFRFNGATNTFTGPVNILGGVLGIEKDATLGDVNNAINIANGARLTAEPGNGGNTFNLAATRTVTLNGAQSQIGVSGATVTLSISGNVTGVGGLTKTDGGALILDGTADYQGDTRIVGYTTAFNLTSGTFTQLGSVLLQAQAGGLLDFSALTNFTMNGGTKSFQVVPNTSSGIGVINQLNLAKGGANGGLNTITANSMQIGGGNTSAGSLHEGQLYLGTTNFFNLNTNGMLIGGFNASGLIAFQGGLTSPFLKIRGTNGTSRMAGTFKVGETSSGTRSGAGNLNLSGGIADVLVTDMTIGRHIAGANNSESSTVTVDAGILDAISITMSEKDNGGAGASWPTFNDTFNQNGGTVKAAKFVMGNDLKLTNLIVINAAYNLNNGTLYAGSIGGGVGGYNTIPSVNRTFNLNGGVIRNYDSTSNLVINGVGTPRYARISLVVGGPVSFYADAGRSITVGTNASLEGGADFTKDGPGTLFINSGLINSGTGKLTVNAGTLGGNGTLLGLLEVGAAGILSPGTSVGTLTVSNDVTLAGTNLMELDFNSGVSTNSDLLAGVTTLNYGGTLILSSIGGVIPAGLAFKLFDATTYAGGFTTVIPPAGYTVSTANLLVDGTISIVTAPIAVPPSPTLSVERDGGDFVFNWTSAASFKLQAQTNALSIGISNNWVDVAGGSTPPVTVPSSKGNPAVFFRLKSVNQYP